MPDTGLNQTETRPFRLQKHFHVDHRPFRHQIHSLYNIPPVELERAIGIADFQTKYQIDRLFKQPRIETSMPWITAILPVTGHDIGIADQGKNPRQFPQIKLRIGIGIKNNIVSSGQKTRL